MRERNIIWDILIVVLLFLLVVINGITLLQNQSIEKRFIGQLDELKTSEARFLRQNQSLESNVTKALDELTAAEGRNLQQIQTVQSHITKELEDLNAAVARGAVANPDIKRNNPPATAETAAPTRSPSYFDGSTNPHWPTGDEKAEDGDTLTLNEFSEPNSLNPIIDNDATTRDIFDWCTDLLARRAFGHPAFWEPRLAKAWESATICRGIAAKKNAKELAAKLNAAMTPDLRAKYKIAKIEAESDEILRVNLNDVGGDYREPVIQALGADAIETQHWLYITYEGEKFLDGMKITAASVAERVRAAIQAAPGFNGRFLSNWERDGSVAILMTGDVATAEKAIAAYIASDASKGEVAEAKAVTGKVVKNVLSADATEHYVFEEKPVFTFYLRKGIRWHDGVPFTGKDVVFSFDAMMDPKVEAPTARNAYESCVSVKLVDNDPFKVQFVWKKPFFLAFAASCELDLFPEHLFHFADGDEFNKNTLNQKVMGTGPFKFESRDLKQQIVLVRNEDYWDKKPHFGKVVLKFVNDFTVSLELLKKGDLDVHPMRKGQAHLLVDDAAFKKRFNIEVSVANVYRYIGWNIRRDIFSSTQTRQALTMLIDRQRIIDKIYFGFADPLDVPAHPESPTYPKNAAELRIPYDVEKAKALLKDDGWVIDPNDKLLYKTFNGKRTPFRFNFLIQSGSPELEAIANQMKESFAQAGIDVNIQNLEWSVFIQNVERLNYDAMMLAWRLTVDDDPYQLWHSSQTKEKASNHCGYINKEVDRWIEEGRRELDADKRNAIFQKVYTQVAKEQPYTFLFVDKRTVAYDNRIQNVEYNFQNKMLERWWVPRARQKGEKLKE